MPPGAADGGDSDMPDSSLPADGLLAWYRMEEVSRTGVVTDETGRHDGACADEGCPKPTEGVVGGALLFDGQDDHIRIPDDLELHTGAGTAAAWVYFDADQTGGVVGKAFGPTDDDSWLLFVDPQIDVAASLGFETAAGEILRSGNGPLMRSRWTHVAGTWNQASKTIYIDGDEVASAPAGVTYDDDHDLLIGADEDMAELVIPFTGALDEIRVYGRELSAAEIADLAAP